MWLHLDETGCVPGAMTIDWSHLENAHVGGGACLTPSMRFGTCSLVPHPEDIRESLSAGFGNLAMAFLGS